MRGRRRFLAIGGPTATGKTALAVEVALRLGGELVNADSRQGARRLRVGTAAPTMAELRGVACHLLDESEPGTPLTAAAWTARARSVLDDLARREVPAIVVGGTGQYLRALRRGWTFGGVATDPRQRAELDGLAATAAGREQLLAELRARDAAAAAALDTANPRRVVRAVEILRAGTGTLASRRAGERGLHLDLVVLDAEAAVHRAAIDSRMAAMFGGGALVDEVLAELRRGTSRQALSASGIGYREALDLIDGTTTVDAATARTRQRTTRYAKAQRTWFRHEEAVLRLVRTELSTVADLADAVVAVVAPSPGGAATRRAVSRSATRRGTVRGSHRTRVAERRPRRR